MEEIMLRRETRSLCSACKQIVPAEIFEKDSSLFISKKCLIHGVNEELFYENKTFYETITKTVSKVPFCTELTCPSCDKHIQRVKSIFIDITERCNFNCPICFSDANRNNIPDNIPLNVILKGLSVIEHTKDKPSICLSGGEPTMRDDLFDLISELKNRGFIVKLVTNGTKLADEGYVKALKSAGVDWILLQFDGFSDDIYLQLRGRKLLDIKLRAIDLLRKYKLRISLDCCIVKGINDKEIGKILDFGLRTEGILHIAFLPYANQGRNLFSSERHRTSALFVMEELGRQTRGRITVSDFMASRRIGYLFFKLFKRAMYQQTNCFFHAVIASFGQRYYPLNRFLEPGFLIRNLRAAALVLVGHKNILEFNRVDFSGNLKLISIEEFRDENTIDLVDASRCNKVYLTHQGFVPPCIYNAVFRE